MVPSPTGPQCESNTELWTDESTRCLCSAGELSCSPSQCPKGHVCGPQRGGSSGISTSGTCTIHRHTECSTFDGVLFRFLAPCTYVLAKTCSPTDALPMFSVEVVYEQNGNSSLTTVQQVTVKIGKFSVSLLNKETYRVVVSGNTGRHIQYNILTLICVASANVQTILTTSYIMLSNFWHSNTFFPSLLSKAVWSDYNMCISHFKQLKWANQIC